MGYMVGNLDLWWCVRGAVKRDFQPYTRGYTSPSETFEYGYPHSNALLQFCLKLECCKPHKAPHHPKNSILQDILLQIFDLIYQNQVHLN